MNARRNTLQIALKTAVKATSGGGTVRYEREVDGDVLSCDLHAGRGTTSFEMTEESTQLVTTIQSQDFFFRASELVFPGNDQPTQPQLRDRIVETDGDGNEFVYMVLDNNGMPRFRYMDPYRDFIRVHTKLIVTP